MKFEELDVWKFSARLAAEVVIMAEHMKIFGFRDQIVRSAVSIPSNIAEGSERNSPRELIQFLGYAKGSCGELRTQLYIAMKAKQLDPEQTLIHIETTRRISAMLHSLIKSIRKRQSGNKTRWDKKEDKGEDGGE